MKRILALLLAAALLLLCLPTLAFAVEDGAITLNRDSLDLARGKSFRLRASFHEGATNRKLTWSSGDTSVASVNASGLVKGKATGETLITVQNADGQSATAYVRVIVPVSKVKLSEKSLSLFVGATAALKATVTPKDATDSAPTWKSSDESVATVDENGLVEAVAAGKAKISASAGGKSASLTVTVLRAPDGVTLSRETLSLSKGKSATLKAAVTPSNAGNKTVTWSSSDKTVATVSKGGRVTAKGAGEAVISARTANGLTAQCRVTVTIPVTGVKLKPNSLTLSESGNAQSLRAAVSPANASNPAVVWTSANERVATVDANGLVTPVAAGKTKITASAANGKSASATVTVKAAVTGISLSAKECSLKAGASRTLKATVTPKNAGDTRLTWTSSDTAVAVVNAGKVTAKAEGTAVIRASANGGKDVWAECLVTVTGSSKKVIALTFDDGPCNTTLSILDTLDQYGVKATFFVLGSNVKRFPEVVARAAAQGCEIGSHGYSHTTLTKLTAKEYLAEFARTDELIYEETGAKPKVCRAPGGTITQAIAKRVGRPFVQWNVDTLDWKYRNANYVYNAVIKGAADQKIVLMHDIRPTTAEAVKRIVPKLIQEGYTFVTVSELIAITGGVSADDLIYRP